MDEAAYFDFIRAGCADEESFLEEFGCQPSDDASAFLSYDLIASCEYPAGATHECILATDQLNGLDLEFLRKCGRLYVGVDIGRTRDLTVIWVVELLGDVKYTRAIICLDKRRYAEQRETLYPILELPNMARCCIDKNGIGNQFAEDAAEKFTAYRVEGFGFTNQSKAEIAPPLKAAFEDRTLRLPNDGKIRADLRSIRKETTASNNTRYAGERTANGHADRFWALALALYAAKQTGTAYGSFM
jgi:phage FluMu gp28-like protein